VKDAEQPKRLFIWDVCRTT